MTGGTNVLQGRVFARDCREACEKILQQYPSARVRAMQYVGSVDGLEWWEFVAVEVSA